MNLGGGVDEVDTLLVDGQDEVLRQASVLRLLLKEHLSYYQSFQHQSDFLKQQTNFYS